MALTAREWLLLPEKEMEKRKGELSKEECAKLRLELDMIHFTEDEKKQMTEEEKYHFTHPQERTVEEKNAFNQRTSTIFKQMQDDLFE